MQLMPIRDDPVQLNIEPIAEDHYRTFSQAMQRDFYENASVFKLVDRCKITRY